jgi:hypothetical protein
MANNCPGEKPLATATAVDGGNGSSGQLPVDDVDTKKQHSFPPLTLQRMWTTYYPFIHEPDERELVMYRCLMLSKPFACKAKGMDEAEAWTIAAQEINYQKNFRTGKPVFDPPISAENVRERFEAVMKIAKDVQPEVPFSFTEYDPDEPEMITLLRDLDDLKTRFESSRSEPKGNAADKKRKKDREAWKVEQRAVIGHGSEWDDIDGGSNNRSKTSMGDAVAALDKAFAEKSDKNQADRELKRQRLEAQLEKHRQQHEKLMEKNRQQHEMQMALYNAMLDTMKAISEKLEKNKSDN